MIASFRVIDKATVERQHVLCDPAEVRRLYPPELYYLPRRLAEAPGEADVFEGGRLRHDADTAARIAGAARLARMTRGELIEEAAQRAAVIVLARLAAEKG